MKNALIYKDEQRIKEAKNFFERSIIFMQYMHEKFSKAGFKLDLHTLAEIVLHLRKAEVHESWLIEKLGAWMAATLQPINHDTLLSMIYDNNLLPGIKTLLYQKLPSECELGIYCLEPNLMAIKGGKILAKDNALEIIERRYCFYANNEMGQKLAGILSDMAASMNRFHEYLSMNNTSVTGFGQDIPGLRFANYVYMPDMSFIRDQERLTETRRSKPNRRTILETD